ncbi:MAG: DUF4403 family protein [Bacteroidota bacterium]
MKKIFFLIIACIVVFACNTIKPIQPSESYNPPVYTPTASSLNIPIEISEKQLEADINKQLQGLIYEDKSMDDNGGDNLMIKAWKKENISIKISNNQISYRIPLKLWIRAGYKFEKFGVTLSDYKDINAEIALKFITAYTVKKDWTLVTSTTDNGYEWFGTPTITIGSIDFPIKKIADGVLKSQLKTLAPMIDDQLKKYFNLKKVASDAWATMQKPILVEESYKTWFRNSPQEVTITPLIVKDGIIKTTIGIKTITESFVGKQPEPVKLTILPSLTIVNSPSTEYVMNMYVDVPYKIADSLSRINMINQTFEQGKKKITVKDLSLFGSNNKLIINTLVEGSVKGNIFFTGIPFYEKETKSIRVKEVDFDINTKNTIIKSANWMFHNTLIKLVENKMSYSIKDYLDEYSKMTQDYLSNYKISEQITLKGSVSSFDVGDVILMPESIRVLITCKGTASLIYK